MAKPRSSTTPDEKWTVSIGRRTVEIVFDMPHIAAHLTAFEIPFSRVVDLVRRTIARRPRGEVVKAVRSSSNIGVSKCVTLKPRDVAFWGHRPGREIPSHLVVGAGRPTREMTIVGRWLDRKRFFVRTVYPGPLAPREIHDPEITLGEIDEAIAFWSTHALVVRGRRRT